MSKKKKTLEELLEEAILTEEERPYEVPDNWVWVRTETTNNVVTGSTPAKKHSEYYGGDFPFVKPTDLEQGREVIHASEYLTDEGKAVSRIIPKESTMVCCIGSIGKAGFSTVECTTNQQINSLVPNKKMINPKFNYYQVLNGTYQNELWNRSSATTVSIINKGKMSLIPYVLPPLNEQKRIAEKVERLLCRIDEAKQLIEEANETFELRRAAILDKAFRGELTSEWRMDNNEEPVKNEGNNIDNTLYSLPSGWRWTDLNVVCEKITDGTHNSPKSYPSGDYMYITAKNIKKHGIILNNITYVSKEVHQEIYNRCDVKKGDVLYIKDGATAGVATLNQITEEFSLLSSVALLRPKDNVLLAKYLMYCLNSPSIKSKILEMVSGNAISRLTLKKIKQSVIPLPPFNEQKVIVSILDKLDLIDKQLDYITNLDSVINNLKKSILYKAFKGELGTNDSFEKSVVEVLKKIPQ